MSKSSARVLLVRHGAVSPPDGCSVYGDLDVPLSPLGIRQSEAAAIRLRGESPAAIVSSDLARAVHLAERMSAQHPGAPLSQDPRLREIHRGHWAGLADAEIEERWPGALERYQASGAMLAPPGGESFATQAARVRAALDEISAKHPGQTVIVCAHLWVLRIAAVSALGQSLEQLASHWFEKCAQIEVHWSSPLKTVGEVRTLPTPELN